MTIQTIASNVRLSTWPKFLFSSTTYPNFCNMQLLNGPYKFDSGIPIILFYHEKYSYQIAQDLLHQQDWEMKKNKHSHFSCLDVPCV